MENSISSRDSFRSRRGFIIACIGSAVGMGNIWLFPYRVATFGGAFLIAYLFCVVIIGFTGVIGEMTFGRAMKSGPMGAFESATERAGRGRTLGGVLSVVPVISSLALAIGYSVVVGWIIKYLVGSVDGSLFAAESVGAYFGGITGSFGNVPFHLIGLIAAFLIMIFGIARGIEKANKVMMPLFFLLFVGLAIYGGIQSSNAVGFAAAYAPIFSIDTATLANPNMWMYALGQAFFSLSLAGSGTLVYGSYLKDDTDVPYCATMVALFDTLAAFVASLVIIPPMVASGTEMGRSVGLMFISLPSLFQSMGQSGRVIMIVFFVAVLFAGLSSLINLFEAPIEALQTKFKLHRAPAVGVIAVIGTAVALCIENGDTVSAWMDVCSIYLCPIGALLAAILFFWVCGKQFPLEQANLGAQHKLGGWFMPAGRYVFCGLTALVLVLGTIMGGIG